MAKFTHHISCPVGGLTAGEQRGTEWKNKALVSPSLPPPPPPPTHPPRACPSHTLPAALALSPQIHRKALIWMEKEAERRRPTLTQLVRLMKRIGGPRVRAQTHGGTGTPLCSGSNEAEDSEHSGLPWSPSVNASSAGGQVGLVSPQQRQSQF